MQVYNLRGSSSPAYMSAAKTGKHSDVVWQVGGVTTFQLHFETRIRV